MKKELGSGIVVCVALVAVALLALIAWRMFSLPPPPADTPEARADAQKLAESFKNNARQAVGKTAHNGAPGSTP